MKNRSLLAVVICIVLSVAFTVDYTRFQMKQLRDLMRYPEEMRPFFVPELYSMTWHGKVFFVLILGFILWLLIIWVFGETKKPKDSPEVMVSNLWEGSKKGRI